MLLSLVFKFLLNSNDDLKSIKILKYIKFEKKNNECS